MHFYLLEKISEIRLCQSSQDFIDALSSQPIALIICSQTYNGKARFVNELLAEYLLPAAPTVKKDDVVRMIRIKVNMPKPDGAMSKESHRLFLV